MPEKKDDLRPANLDEFVGQAQLKERLNVMIEAARLRMEPLPHVFLSGPPGFGKTTLATLIASELGDPLLSLQMPIDEKLLLYELDRFDGGVLFLDELHAMNRRMQEFLFPLLTDNEVRDRRGRVHRTSWLTVIGATTERDKVLSPLLDRFPIAPEFEPYDDAEMEQIVSLMAQRCGIELPYEVREALGRAAGGIPRAAESLVFAARDLFITGRTVSSQHILELCGRDEDGLTVQHVQYLEVLRSQRNVAGQKTIEMLLRLPAATIRELERLLLERGLIEYTATGRELTPKGEKKLRGETNMSGYCRSDVQLSANGTSLWTQPND